MGGGSSLQGRSAKNWEKGVFVAPKAMRKFFEKFLEIFGKFVNTNAIKSGIYGVIIP